MSQTENSPLLKKLGLTEAPTKTSANFDTSNGAANGEASYLKVLELALLLPVLSLVKMYLIQANGTGKTSENCLLDFRKKHARAFFFAFCIDFFFRIFYVLVVIIVTVRGLGLDQYFRTLFLGL